MEPSTSGARKTWSTFTIAVFGPAGMADTNEAFVFTTVPRKMKVDCPTRFSALGVVAIGILLIHCRRDSLRQLCMLLLKHWPYSGAGDLPRKVVRAKGQAGLVGSPLKSNRG